MVRRLLLTALVATLGVALPAAAEGEPGYGLAGSDPAGCLSYDASVAMSCAGAAADACVAQAWSCAADAVETSSAWAAARSLEGPACRSWDLNTPDANQPLTETFILDPEGCLQSFLRRTLGWPPAEVAAVAESAPLPVVETVLSWT
jgi:hypothetical protein